MCALHRKIVFIAVCVYVMCSPGCNRSSITATPKPASRSDKQADLTPLQEKNNWDFDVVLYDKTTQLCIPLSDPRIVSVDDIVQIDSSCDCVDSTVVSYLDSEGVPRIGLAITISERFFGDNEAKVGSKLRVQTQLHLRDKSYVKLVFQFLLTCQIDWFSVKDCH